MHRCTTTYDDPDSRMPVDLEIIRAAYTAAVNLNSESLGREGQRVLVLSDRTLPTLRTPQHEATPYLPTQSRTSPVTS